MIKSTESNRSILYNLIKLNNIEGDENFVDLKNADMSPLSTEENLKNVLIKRHV